MSSNLTPEYMPIKTPISSYHKVRWGLLAVALSILIATGTLTVIALRDHSLENLRLSSESDTRVAFGALHAALRDYTRTNAIPPSSLDAVLTLRRANSFTQPTREWLLDGWGKPIVLNRLNHSYELRSAGPDGRFGNSDDLVSIP